MEKINKQNILYFPLTLIGVLFFYIHFAILFPLFLKKQSDFWVLTRGSKKILSKKNPYLGKPISKANHPEIIKKFAYPPLTALLFYPLVKMPYNQAKLIFLILNEVILFLSILLMGYLFKINLVFIFFVWSISLIFFPVVASLSYGQVNIILLFLILLFIYFWDKKKELAGFILALAIFLKVMPVIILFFLFFTSEKKLVFWTLIFSIFLSVLSIALYGVKLNIYYLNHLIALASAVDTSFVNQSIDSFLRRIVANYSLSLSKILNKMFSLILIALTSYQVYSLRNKPLTKNIFYFIISQAIILMLILPAYSWHHRYVLLLFVYVFVLTTTKNKVAKFLTIISFIFNAYHYKFYDLLEVNSLTIKIFYNMPFLATTFLFFILSFVVYNEINKLEKFEI